MIKKREIKIKERKEDREKKEARIKRKYLSLKFVVYCLLVFRFILFAIFFVYYYMSSYSCISSCRLMMLFFLRCFLDP